MLYCNSIDLLKIKRDYMDLEIIFNFLDKISLEIKKVSLEIETNDTIRFFCYIDSKEYIVQINEVNNILRKSYDEYIYDNYFFNLKNKIGLVWGNNKWFNFFFKQLLFSLKKSIIQKIIIDKKYVYNSIINNSRNMFNSKKDQKEFFELLNNNLIKFNLEDLVLDYYYYFDLSLDIFFFCNDEKSVSYCRYYKYFDLIQLLEKNELKIIKNQDISFKLLVLICFFNSKITNLYI